MDFKVDKKKVSEGDVVEISWSCPQAQNAKITLDNGVKSSSAEITGQGTKKFRLNRSGSTIITIEAVVNGKSVKKSEKISVSPSKERLAEEKRQKEEARRQKREASRQKCRSFWKHSKGTAGSSSDERQYDSYENLSNHPLREKLRTWKSRLGYSWRALPPQKKQAYIVVLAICAIMIGASFYPPITYFGLCAISFYLLWTLMRR